MLMKFLKTTPLVLLVFLLSGCFPGRKQIMYEFKDGKDVFGFEIPNPDTLIKDTITFSTIEINTSLDEPIWIHFIYSEVTPHVKKLTSIKATLSEVTEQGRYKELPAICTMDIEYFNGENQVKISLKNNTAPLNTLVNWNDVNYKYEFLEKEYVKEDNSITYTNSCDFKPESYPDTLRLAVEFTWENGSRKYETFLTKKEYSGPKLNPKF
jgi:hypothetical protein